MGQILVYLIPAVIAFAIFGVFVRLSMPKQDAVSIEERLQTFAERPRTLEEIELEQPFSERVIKPMVAALTSFASKLTPSQSAEKQRQQLVLAGNPYNMQVTEYTALRVICGVIMAVLAVAVGFLMELSTIQLILAPAVGGALGFLAPSFWLGRKIKQRKKAVQKI